MNINESAPVKATREVYIEAAAGSVWTILTGIDRWPGWNAAVSRARLEGSLKPGTIFRWKSGGSSIVSTLQEIEPGNRVSWTGRTLGVAAVHVWTLRPQGSGVLVTTLESFEGWLVRLFRGAFQRLLDRSLEDTLHALKSAAEGHSAK
jgi:hypothetical protein